MSVAGLTRYHETKFALGGDVTLVIVAAQADLPVADLLRRLWRRVYLFERQFSRFLPQSELSRFNRMAGLPQRITPEFRNLLLEAQRLGRSTGGLYNPFILPALQRAGYTKSFAKGYEADVHDDYSDRRVVPVAELTVGETTAQIPFGSALDLGGCGKGYLADLLADEPMPEWVRGFWFSLGGDVAGAGYDEHGEPWTVHISSALDSSVDSPWSVRTTGERFGVATSGTTVRSGRRNGRSWHHIIDPRTLRPSRSDLILSTVLTERAVDADVLASCAIILGRRDATEFLKAHGAQGALLQGVDRRHQVEELAWGGSFIKLGEVAHA